MASEREGAKKSRMSLDDLRRRIDSVDDRLLDLLAERAELVSAVADAKRGAGLATVDPEREKALLERLLEKGAGVFPREAILAVFREVISASVSMQAPIVIAYLGPEGTYSHLAARTLFGYAPTYLEEASIDGVFDAVTRSRASFGVVPLENSTEGSVASAIDALLEGGCFIRRELVLPIDHSLMSRAAALTDIERVYSHPQALAQCRDWLAASLPHAQLVHTASTAQAVRESGGDPRAAAIGSPLASELHGIPILRDRIQDHSHNATRFVMIGKEDAKPTGDDKTTVAFAIRDDDRRGSLRRTLAAFDDHEVNMTRIESRPSRVQAWRYVFVVDVEGHRSDPAVAAALAALAERCESVKVLGSYPRFPRV